MMRPSTLSLYAFEPGAPGVPAGSGTGVFVTSVVNALRGAGADEARKLELRIRWLRPAARRAGPLGETRAAAAWLWGELTRMLGDGSRYLLFIYPKVPVLAHVTDPAMLGLAHRAYQALALKSKLGRARGRGRGRGQGPAA